VVSTGEAIYIVKMPPDRIKGLVVTADPLERIRSARAHLRRFGAASDVYLSVTDENDSDEMISPCRPERLDHEIRRASDPNIVQMRNREDAEDLVRYLTERAGLARSLAKKKLDSD